MRLSSIIEWRLFAYQLGFPFLSAPRTDNLHRRNCTFPEYPNNASLRPYSIGTMNWRICKELQKVSALQ
jgi:hypothetical protein